MFLKTNLDYLSQIALKNMQLLVQMFACLISDSLNRKSFNKCREAYQKIFLILCNVNWSAAMCVGKVCSINF